MTALALKKNNEKLYPEGLLALNTHMSEKLKKQPASEQTPSFDVLLKMVGTHKDKAAFIQLFEYFAPRVKAFLIKNGINDSMADELAQETLLTVWHKAEHFNPDKANASTWIYTIARNKRIDAIRKLYRPDPEIDFDNNEPESPDEAYNEIETTEHIGDAVKTLPEEQKILIEKAFFEDKSHSTIAQEMSIPLGTVKSRIRLALGTLRNRLNMFKDNIGKDG